MRLIARFVAIALVGAAIVACTLLESFDGLSGGAADAGEAGTEAGTIASACRLFAELQCSRSAGCSPGTLQFLYGGPSVCVDLLAERCVAEVASPDSNVTAELFERCLDSIRAQSCADIIDQVPARNCTAPGKRAAGSTCISDFQCAEGGCVGRDQHGCGTCAGLAREGEACGSCERTLLCVAGTCKKRGLLGAPCGANDPCSRAFRCVAGTCSPLAGLGEVCAVSEDCDLGQSLACTAIGRCSKVEFAAQTGACGAVDGRFLVCPAGTCGGPDGSTTCTPNARVGEACGPAVANCFFVFNCLAGQCAVASDDLCPR